VKGSSLRWGLIASWGGFALAMVGLSIYRSLQAWGGDPGKALVFFGALLGALCVIGAIVALQYRRAARTTRGLLAVLGEKYPGQAFAMFKTGGLQEDVATLAPALRGAAWDKWTLYAVLTLDAEFLTIWDGSAKKPVVTARLDRSELRGVGPAQETARLFHVRALELAVSHDGVVLRLTVAPARPGDWIFFPAADSYTALESTLASSIGAPTAS
jgi:hypothetical protein